MKILIVYFFIREINKINYMRIINVNFNFVNINVFGNIKYLEF